MTQDEESKWYSSCLKVGRFETKEEHMFQFEFEWGKREPMSQVKGQQAGRILSYSGEGQPLCSIQAFNYLDEAHTNLRGHSTLLNLPM